MSKKFTVGGNRKHFVQRPGTCHTSPARVRLWRRRAEAISLREQNLTYREIAKRLGCKSATIAHQLVIGALAEMSPIEQRDTVRQMEISRLGKLMATYFPPAQKGNASAAKVYLKVAAEHSKLCGLYPEGGGLTINNNNVVAGSAADHVSRFGISVKFCKPPPGHADDVDFPPPPAVPALPPPAPLIEHEPIAPAPDRPASDVVSMPAPFESAFARKRHWMD
jgi:hypothetical protein